MTTPAPFCLGCRYSLAGLAKGKCPECGREFDSAQRDSVGPRTFPRIQQVAALRPPMWLIVAYGTITLLLFGLRSAPNGFHSDEATLDFVLWIGASVFVCAPIILIHGAAVIWLRLHRIRRGFCIRWLAFPLSLILCFWMGREGLFFRARWYFAQDEFTVLAATPPSTWKPGWIGTFHVISVQPNPDGTAILRLGFPDTYSDQPVQVRYKTHDGDDPPWQKDLGDSWWIWWDPF